MNGYKYTESKSRLAQYLIRVAFRQARQKSRFNSLLADFILQK